MLTSSLRMTSSSGQLTIDQPGESEFSGTLSLFLRLFQQQVATWVKANFDASIKHYPLLGVQEEVGELAHAFLKSEQGIRGDAETHRAAMIDAVGDIVIYLADFCTRNGIDLHDAVVGTWAGVRQRDWKKNPAAG